MKRCMQEKEEIRRQVSEGGDPQVIKFIYDILYHSGTGGLETVRNLFASGYCYYFAKMLEDAFPGGQACVAWPFGHIVYLYNSVAYDIDGVSTAEYEQYIPVSFIGDAVNDFRHIAGQGYCTTAEEVEEIGTQWEALRITAAEYKGEEKWTRKR